MKLLFVDTETNSLDTEHGFIQELAWALYDAESKRLLNAESFLIRWNLHYEVDPGAVAVTGLTRDFCEKEGQPATQTFLQFIRDVNTADALVGHNWLEFDRQILTSNIKRGAFADPTDTFESKLNIDTMFDLPIQNPRQIMALKYLALDHGYILSDAHQALADVFACAAVFFKYPLEKILEISKTPLVTLRGFTHYHDQTGREAFHRQKFKWNRDAKCWERKCRAYYIPGTQLELGKDLWTPDGECFPINRETLPLSDKPFDELPF